MKCFALATRTTTAQSASAWGIFAVALSVAACQPAPSTASGTAGAEKPLRLNQSAATVLPLQRGYYVANDTPCAKASNATLLLLQRHGIGGARDFCEFKQIDQSGPEIYQVHEVCADLQGSDPQSRTVRYRIVANTRFVVSDHNGVVLDARHCPQADLPTAWRNIDIRAEVE
jgi:hypothetical protein